LQTSIIKDKTMFTALHFYQNKYFKFTKILLSL